MAHYIRLFIVLGVLDLAWHLGAAHGYNKATDEITGQWYEGPEGYCLAENHAGPCK